MLLCSQNLNYFHYRKSLETSIAPNLPLMERIGIKYKRPTTFNDGDCYLIDIKYLCQLPHIPYTWQFRFCLLLPNVPYVHGVPHESLR